MSESISLEILLDLLFDRDYFSLGPAQVVRPQLRMELYGLYGMSRAEIMLETIETRRSLLDVSQETLDAFLIANDIERDLRELGSWPTQFIFLEEEEFDHWSESPNWSWEFDFHVRYPKSRGLLSVSFPGINSAKTEAIVFSSQVTSNFSSDCKFCVLKRYPDCWKCTGGALTMR
jgi:hypothetical protein